MSAVAFLNTFSAIGKSISRLERRKKLKLNDTNMESAFLKIHRKFELIHALCNFVTNRLHKEPQSRH
jgi:hypothetical protein